MNQVCCFSIFSSTPCSSLCVSLYIIFFFFSFSFLNETVKSSVDPHFPACESRTCGDDQNISFPFFITGLQESYCGYPGFDVSCDRGHPIINISNTLYIIQKINYNNQSFRVSNAVYSTLEANSSACLPPTSNITLPSENRFQFAAGQTDLFLYFGCDPSSPPNNLSEYKFDCSSSNSSNQTDAVFALSGESNFNISSVSKNCQNGKMLHMLMEHGFGNISISKESVVKKLQEGFLLNWRASDCSVCAESGGRCGFDADTLHFQCYCLDRVHAKKCSIDNTVEVTATSPLETVQPHFTVEILERFTPIEFPECGAYAIQGCNDQVQKINATEDGKWYALENIDQGNSIFLADKNVETLKHYQNCNEKKSTKYLLLGIILSFGGAVIVFIIGFTLWCCKRRHASPDIPSKSDMEGGSIYFGVPVYSYIELEKATNHFDHTKELGDGGFGTVYHGKLRDGREVAVKRLYEHNYRRIQQFINEVKILTRLRHKNLVTLYGCTSQRSRELLLVYEYIPNGTVADHLHGDRAKPGSLPWPIRMNIAIETATALAYLHASDIVHRDVKTNNILLDNSFCVKVADFGLSRLFPNDVSHVSTAPQGTPGYVDPEYHECYQLTSKSDVYSFGVVLVELISSMPPVDISRHRHEINLATLAVNKIQKRAYEELIDPSLGSENDDVKTMIISVAELAFQCLQLDKEMRPSMDEVLEALTIIQHEKGKAATMDEANVHAEISSQSLQLPPPSPDCDELGLIRCMKPTNSPTAVIDNWSSNLTTPNYSS